MLGVHMMGGPPWKLARSWYRVPLPIKVSMALTSLCLSAAPKDFTFRLTLLPPPQPDVFRPVLVSSTVVVVADSLTGFPMGIASVVGSSVVGTSLVASSGVVTSVVSTSSVVIPLVASVVAVLASSIVIPV